MKESLILTIVGRDQPGIVNRISALVSEHGGNWHESRMAHLAGQFVGLMHAQIDRMRYQELCAALQSLSQDGLQVTVVRDAAVARVPDADSQSLHLEATGSDHPGIVRDISAVLIRHGVNVEELDTAISPAPMSSHSVFTTTARMNAPRWLDLGVLQDDLESLSHDLMIDLHAQQAGS